MAKKDSIEKGAIVRLDYTAYLTDTKNIFDTTVEADAKEAQIYNEKYTYAPMPYIVGSMKFFPLLDEAIGKAAIGKETSVVISAEDGAGARDPKLMETHSIKEFIKMEIDPYPGLEVSLGNKRGTIARVGSGRVVVDFNNPLAGREVEYKFTVKEVIDKPEDKAKAILELDFGTSEDFKFDVLADKVVVTVSEVVKFHQDWAVARFKIVSDLRDVFNVDTIEFVEVWSRAPAKEEEKPKAKKAAPKKDADGEAPAAKKAAAKPKADAAATEEKPKKAAPKKPAAKKE
jgi:FKBP-type peptidyl-prolyl cis-trans isomerases 2